MLAMVISLYSEVQAFSGIIKNLKMSTGMRIAVSNSATQNTRSDELPINKFPIVL